MQIIRNGNPFQVKHPAYCHSAFTPHQLHGEQLERCTPRWHNSLLYGKKFSSGSPPPIPMRFVQFWDKLYLTISFSSFLWVTFFAQIHLSIIAHLLLYNKVKLGLIFRAKVECLIHSLNVQENIACKMSNVTPFSVGRGVLLRRKIKDLGIAMLWGKFVGWS